jgi:glycosyltransferase involved in cell wall biosynthesis
VDLVIRAIAQLRDAGVNARLIIAGQGSAADELRALLRELNVEDRVELTGFVSEARKRELFRRAWVHVLTSPKEGWGISIIEAAACGTATVGSDSPGLRDSVQHEHTGFLVPHEDVAALADRLRLLLQDPALRDRLGSNARHFAEQFSWERSAALTEAHLGRTLARSERSRSPR